MKNAIMNVLRRFKERSFAILAFETLLFSFVYGVASRSWLVFVLMAAGLFWILCGQKGVVFCSILLSLLWGHIAASISYSSGSWVWAVIGGFVFFDWGIRAHNREVNFLARMRKVREYGSRINQFQWRPGSLN